MLNEHSLDFLTKCSSHDNNIIKKLNRLIDLLETKRDIINSTIIFFLYNINLENTNKFFNHETMNIVYSIYINTYIYICKLVIIKHFCYNIKYECSVLDEDSNIKNFLNITQTAEINAAIIQYFDVYKNLFIRNKINNVLITSFELTDVFNFFKNILNKYILTDNEGILLPSRIDKLISLLSKFNEKTLIMYKCEYIIYRIITIPLKKDFEKDSLGRITDFANDNQRFFSIIKNLQEKIFTEKNLKQLLTNEHFLKLFDEDMHDTFKDKEILTCAYYCKSLIYIINNFIVDNYYDFGIKYHTGLANQKGGTRMRYIIKKLHLLKYIHELEKRLEEKKKKSTGKRI